MLFKGVAYRVSYRETGAKICKTRPEGKERRVLLVFLFKFQHMIPLSAIRQDSCCKTALREGKTSPKTPVVLPPAAVDGGGRAWGMVMVLRKEGAGFFFCVNPDFFSV